MFASRGVILGNGVMAEKLVLINRQLQNFGLVSFTQVKVKWVSFGKVMTNQFICVMVGHISLTLS